jgi:hypothetical protein
MSLMMMEHVWDPERQISLAIWGTLQYFTQVQYPTMEKGELGVFLDLPGHL